MDFSRKYLASLVCNAMWRAESAGKLLKLRWSYGIKGLELYRSASKTASKCAGTPFMKLNGKSRLKSFISKDAGRFEYFCEAMHNKI